MDLSQLWRANKKEHTQKKKKGTRWLHTSLQWNYVDTSNMNLCLLVFDVAWVRLPGQRHLPLCIPPALCPRLPTGAGQQLTVPSDRWVFWSDMCSWGQRWLLDRFVGASGKICKSKGVDLCGASGSVQLELLLPHARKELQYPKNPCDYRLLLIDSLVPSILTKGIY